mmetsp:Transcript_19258/g.39029  ORF Transcript_19258/g.39029 Transcript_19258/m.39029 type:complete len:235 (+) Transcript_19258:90-794(+)
MTASRKACRKPYSIASLSSSFTRRHTCCVTTRQFGFVQRNAGRSTTVVTFVYANDTDKCRCRCCTVNTRSRRLRFSSAVAVAVVVVVVGVGVVVVVVVVYTDSTNSCATSETAISSPSFKVVLPSSWSNSWAVVERLLSWYDTSVHTKSCGLDVGAERLSSLEITSWLSALPKSSLSNGVVWSISKSTILSPPPPPPPRIHSSMATNKAVGVEILIFSAGINRTPPSMVNVILS